MRKYITRTIKKHECEITLYAFDTCSLQKVNDVVYEMSVKEAIKHFEKKFESIGKVVNVKDVSCEDIKVSVDIETFVNLGVHTSQVSDFPDMPEPENTNNE